MIVITPNLEIDDDEINCVFVRSSGPGGQNVNKVNTAVQLRFDVKNSSSLPINVRERLMRLASNRITTAGILIIEAKRHRSQHQNRVDAVNRLTTLIKRAAKKPRKRRQTKPPPASKKRRLNNKRHRSTLKNMRKTVSPSNE